MLFYAFESSLLPWECTDHENVTINILNWFLFDRFFMLYDSIFFTWFAKRFWVHPFYIDVMPYIVNIIKRCYGILFTAFTCNHLHCYFVLQSLFCFLTPWITDDMELTCPIFLFFMPLFFLRLINAIKWSRFWARDPVEFDHKIMIGFPERRSVLGQLTG